MCKNQECVGPCYDLCDCSHCWNGWWSVPFHERLYWRIRRIIRSRSLA